MTLTDFPLEEYVLSQPGEVVFAKPRLAPAAVVRLPPIDEIAERWFAIAPLLAKATRRTGCYEPIDLLRLAFAGQAAIWLAEVDGELEAALVTTLQVYPRRRVLEVLFGGGGALRCWLPTAIETIEAHARQIGCTQLACVGRKGWARVWTGARLTGDVIIAKDL